MIKNPAYEPKYEEPELISPGDLCDKIRKKTCYLAYYRRDLLPPGLGPEWEEELEPRLIDLMLEAQDLLPVEKRLAIFQGVHQIFEKIYEEKY